ncbi:F-box/kelch-repeat protein At3g06240-like [Primulina eburnea]|uniref:F-box/kelch-repeat protein At3g06240-like n=1 Tax=Primulina eburnea TaxID=1245227 RepID=UPI003C6BFEAD
MADQTLPTDVLIQVLIRLPVKSIVKFRSVSKTWRDLIKSPMFVQEHQKRGRKQRVLLVKRFLPPKTRDYKAISSSRHWTSILKDLEISSYGHLHIVTHSLPPQNRQGKTYSFHDPEFLKLLVSPDLLIPIPILILNASNIPLQRHWNLNISIHGPCNGLICIAFEETVFLCNPALREYKMIPPLRFPLDYISIPLQHGFWFEPITGVYKVIRITNISYMADMVPGAEISFVFGESQVRFDLYNSASNSWKQIDAKVPDISYLPGYDLFYNGTIHWIAINASYSFPSILCFDVSEETSRQLYLPDNFNPSVRNLRLMEFNDSLAVVRYPHPRIQPYKTEIWVMTEYGVKESWTKQFVIGPNCVICPLRF